MSDVYFITGATGAVGAALVPELLKYPDVELRLLLRARDQDHLQHRFQELLTYWDVKTSDMHARLQPMPGDMSQPQFGMAEKDYAQLTKECTHIIHCAGNVRMNLSLAEARKSALGSAQNVIQLAQKCRELGNLQKIELVSTVGVGGKMQGSVPEGFITQQREFHNTYEQAKAEAEDYIQPYVEQGMPITVHRPSMVVGDSKTGKIIHFQVFYHLCEFLSGRRTMGFLPNMRGGLLDIVPVDYVAQALAWASQQDKTAGRILHLCSGPDKALDLMQLASQVGYIFESHGIRLPRSKVIPVQLFRAALPVMGLFAPARTKRAIRALPVFLEYLKQRQVFENRHSRAVLQDAPGILSWNSDLVSKVLGFYLHNR